MTIQATALTALAAAQQRAEAAAEGVRRASSPSPAGDSVDLSEEAVRLLAASREFEAAIELARTGDELTQATLDILA